MGAPDFWAFSGIRPESKKFCTVYPAGAFSFCHFSCISGKLSEIQKIIRAVQEFEH